MIEGNHLDHLGIVLDERQRDGAPIIEDTGIRVNDGAEAYEHRGYDPNEKTQLYPDLSLADGHRALAYYYLLDAFRAAESTPA